MTLGDSSARVQADVHDHARGPERMGAQEPEARLRGPEPAELVHQALGIERPALAMSGHEPELVSSCEGHQPDRGALEVMAGDGLVIDRADLIPGRKALPTHAWEPGPTGSGEVLGG